MMMLVVGRESTRVSKEKEVEELIRNIGVGMSCIRGRPLKRRGSELVDDGAGSGEGGEVTLKELLVGSGRWEAVCTRGERG
jgi:hypothetical protein